MPFKIRKLPSQNSYRVYNPITKKIYSYSTTKEKAQKQIRLLNYLELSSLTPTSPRPTSPRPSSLNRKRSK